MVVPSQPVRDREISSCLPGILDEKLILVVMKIADRWRELRQWVAGHVVVVVCRNARVTAERRRGSIVPDGDLRLQPKICEADFIHVVKVNANRFYVSSKLQSMPAFCPTDSVADFRHRHIPSLASDVAIGARQHPKSKVIRRSGREVDRKIIDLTRDAETRKVGHSRIDDPRVTHHPRTLVTDK